MSYHNYTRSSLYNVSTERLMRRKLVIRKSWLPWSKKCTVYEYAVYECVGQHRNYLGWFSFVEEEYTGWSKKFDSLEQAIKYKMSN